MTTTEALARGLFNRDRNQWASSSDTEAAWESLRAHYIRDVERFLLPEIEEADK